MMADDDRDELDELAAHLVDDGTLAGEEKMTQPYYQMLEQRLHIQGETLRKALEIVRAVANGTTPTKYANYLIFHETGPNGELTAVELRKQARALLADAAGLEGERHGG